MPLFSPSTSNFVSNAIKVVFGKKGTQNISAGNYAYEATNVVTTDRSFIPNFNIDESDITPFTRRRCMVLARYMENNYPLIDALLNNVENYGVGDGISVHARTPHAEFNKSATAFFDNWCSSPFSSVNNDMTQYDTQALDVRVTVRDGEIYTLLVRDLENPVYKFQTQTIMPDQIAAGPGEDDTSKDGIYTDAYGRTVAYGVWSGDNFQKIPASNIIHLKRSIKGSRQLRGVSDFYSCLNDARDHKDINRIQKQASKIKTAVAKVVTKITGDAGKGTAAGTKQNPLTNNPSGALPQRPVPGNTFGMERGFGANTHYISPGEKIEFVSPNIGTTAEFTGFTEHLMRQVCLSAGQPYEFVVNPDKLNGTSMRFIIVHTAQYFRRVQNMLINGKLKRLYAWVISCAIKDGLLQVPPELVGSPDLYNCSFTRPRSITVDEGRITNAEILLNENRMLTFERYFSARGLNYEDEFNQQDAERERLIRSYFKEQALVKELSAQTGIPSPVIPFPVTTTVLGAPSPNTPIPAPTVKNLPDDVESDTSGGDSADTTSDEESE